MERYSKLHHKYMDQLITGVTLDVKITHWSDLPVASEWDGPTEIGRGDEGRGCIILDGCKKT